MLLGADVLPYSLLSATATICRLHHSDRKRFEIVYDDHQNEVHEIQTGEDDTKFLQKLRDIVSGEGSEEERPCKQVEIYWPIPMLTVLYKLYILSLP